MSTGYVIRPRVVKAKTPTGGSVVVAEEVTKYLQSIERVVQTAVQQKMRRGASPYEFSERSSVQTETRGGMRPQLRVFSNSIRAAVEETGATYGGIPPFGPGSALLEWVRQFIDTRNPRWTAKRIALAIHDRGLPRPGDPLRKPFTTTHREQAPQIREGLRRTRAEAARRINLATS